MRRGCIAVGEITCSKCGRTLRHPDRYLAIDEDTQTLRYCLDCALKLGYAYQKEEKGERVITFFSTD
ncbi:MAG: hypothetical protein HY662_03920 [Chloroflexi bacterium]|nr:hypothetical protein [Chloroflexota bacterium]